MTLKHWLQEKPFTLTLSSGFFGFFAHLGVVKALEEAGIQPQKYTGASAGAIIGAAFAGGKTSKEIEERLSRIQRSDFWDPRLGLGILKGEKFEKLLSEMVPARFDELKTPCDVVTFDAKRLRTKVISEGELIKAVRASATMPVFFHPARRDKDILLDGGILDKSGIPKNTEERVFCHYLCRAYDFFEKWQMSRESKALKPEQKMMTIKALPFVSPFHLHRGPTAVDVGYRQMKTALEMEYSPAVFQL
jgi:NTE family protein